MVRYDPTQEDHQKYEQDKHELPKQKKAPKYKTQKKEQAKEPVVDTDKYYKVGEKLKDAFSTQSQFSFTNLFHTSDKNSNKLKQDDYKATKITKPQKKFGQNPFIDDSSDSEEEEIYYDENLDKSNDKVAEVPSGKILGPRGVWREVFFFKIDDSRFKDAETFCNPIYNKTNYTGSQDPRFIKLRDILRNFMKNKNKRHKRDVRKKRFNRKLGGTHQKDHKFRRNTSGKVNKKFEGKNNAKSNKMNDS